MSSYYLSFVLALLILLSPVPARAELAEGGMGVFGGAVVLITPCVGPYGGSLVVDVEGPSGGRFIWSPFTLTYMYGPPVHIGQFILGMHGLPSTCPTAYGRRGALINWLDGPGMIMIGTSGLF